MDQSSGDRIGKMIYLNFVKGVVCVLMNDTLFTRESAGETIQAMI